MFYHSKKSGLFIPNNQVGGTLRRNPSDAGGGGISFNMTAGDFASAIQGYLSSGNYAGLPAIGSISAEPIPGNPLQVLISGNPQVAITGDVTATVTGLTIWVDSVEYPFDGADWAYDGGNDITNATWVSAGPTFVDTVTYFIEIK